MRRHDDKHVKTARRSVVVQKHKRKALKAINRWVTTVSNGDISITYSKN